MYFNNETNTHDKIYLLVTTCKSLWHSGLVRLGKVVYQYVSLIVTRQNLERCTVCSLSGLRHLAVFIYHLLK